MVHTQADQLKSTEREKGKHVVSAMENASSEIQAGSFSTSQRSLMRAQQTIGNRAAIQRFIVQRDDSPASASVNTPGDNNVPTRISSMGLEQNNRLTLQGKAIGIDLVPTSEPGDYPLPNPNADTVMAKRDGLQPAPAVAHRIQRDPPAASGGDDNHPHWGIDRQYGYQFPIRMSPGADPVAPWSYQQTFVYRNVNLWSGSSGRFTLDLLHEPNAALGFDSLGGMSVQAAITLINLHWMAPWHRELELGLGSFINTSILPQIGLQAGVQSQLEAHILDQLSVTFTLQGTWVPPQSSQPGQFNVVGSPGVLFHF